MCATRDSDNKNRHSTSNTKKAREREKGDRPPVAIATKNDQGIFTGGDLEVEGACLASLRASNNRLLPTAHIDRIANGIRYVGRE
jgi:hypothetical protein